MTIDLTQIMLALIGVLATVITGFVIPWIKGKISAQRWEQMKSIVKTAVNAAEQLGYSNQIADKFEYAKAKATEELSKRGLTFDCDTITTAIEEMVLELKQKSIT